MDSQDIPTMLRKHPLALRILDLLSSEQEPLRLQAVANQLGVHKVSAHRVIAWLKSLKLVEVRESERDDFPRFAVPVTRRASVQRLVQAVKATAPLGRGGLSIVSAIVDQVQAALRAKGIEASMPPKGSYDLVCRIENSKAGVEFKTYSAYFVRQSFYESVGRVCAYASEFPLAVLVILGGQNRKLAKESNAMQEQLRKAGIAMEFIWVAQNPLEINAGIVEKDIVAPLVQALRNWKPSAK